MRTESLVLVESKELNSQTFLDDSEDFIQSHIDSHFPPSEEVKEEESDFEAGRGELEVQSDAESDLDNDGLSNIFEHENGLDLNREDTDSDGIVDGEEYEYWQNEKGLSRDESISNCMEPDVDGDDITDVQDCHPSILGIPADGKEINGYEAKVITGYTDDGEPISEKRFVDNRDPTKAYKTESGEWSDTDSDGIPDVVESWFSNTSIATNDSYRQNFVDRWPDLYENYSWVKDYFETVKEEENESKAEQWLTDQFNPMVREKTPPMVTEFTGDTDTDFEMTWTGPKLDVEIETHVIIRDVGGIDYVKLDIVGQDGCYEKGEDELDGKTVHEFEKSFEGTVWDATLGKVTLELTAEDAVDNRVEVDKEVEGAMRGVLSQIWDAIAGVLSDVADAVMDAVSVVVEWLKNKIGNLISKFLDPLKSVIRSFKIQFVNAIQNAIDEYNSTGEISEKTKDKIVKMLFEPMNIIAGAVLALQVAVTAFSVYTGGLGSMLVPMMTSLLIMGVVGFAYETTKKIVPQTSNLTSMVNWILNKFESSNNSEGTNKNSKSIMDSQGELFIAITEGILYLVTLKIASYLAEKGVTTPLFGASIGVTLIVLSAVSGVVSVRYPSKWAKKMIYLLNGALSIIGSVLVFSSLIGWGNLATRISKVASQAVAKFYLSIMILMGVIGIISTGYYYHEYKEV